VRSDVKESNGETIELVGGRRLLRVYVIELIDIVLPRRIRIELRKFLRYRRNSVVNLVNQRINNGMYY
jgi:hypothetical protein